MKGAARDYSLTGASAAEARRRGLADATWYQAPVPPERLQQLARRTNGRAARDTALWVALLVASGAVAALTYPTWWCVPAFLVYGALYGGAADSRWHECGHGTAFANARANDVVYPIASFMVLRNPTQWRWSHVRHHTDTIIVGRDPEIAAPRPPSLRSFIGAFVHVVPTWNAVREIAAQAAGRVSGDVADYTPADERGKVVRSSRVYVVILLAVVVTCVVTRSLLPALLVGLPTVYGGWLMVLFGFTQHYGLRENVLDHRQNTRSVRMNPVFRFLYLNMNYHVEHHMFPTIPYRSLPALHEEVKDHLPPIMPNTFAAYREVLRAIRHQSVDPTWEISDRGIPGIDTPAVADATDGGEASLVVSDDGSVNLGPVAALARGALRRIDLGGQTFVLCRAADGAVALLDGWCTHGHAHLGAGVLRGATIECPKHNGRFELATGAACRRPAREPLGVHRVEIVDRRIVGHVPAAPPSIVAVDPSE